jgi:Tol biopolymer transport system component
VSSSRCTCLAAAAPAIAQVARISVSTAGVEANGPSGAPSVSADGRYVVFASTATNLVADDTNGASDIFLRDRDTDADATFDEAGAVATTRISLGAGATQADGPSIQPAISADGRYVVFGVESAVYRSFRGAFSASGSNAVATPLP